LRPVRVALLAALAVGSQGGCTREFYREWANQDVSEAVFEKSRDPRWRLDTFSIEPPALSRFADPYDQDAPPAPPDDVATEALSPVPQWPSNRLIVPAEGTGYWELLEYWKRQDLAADAAAGRTPLGGAPPNPAVVGLPPNLGAGGVPTSLSSDPASRPGVPFENFPGMANPYLPGGIIQPERAIDADQPAGAENEPIQRVPGGGTEGGNLEILTPGGARMGTGVGGGPGPAGASGPTVAPDSNTPNPPPPIPPPLPRPGSPSAPATTPGSPGAWNGPRPARSNDVIIPIVRLQDGPDANPARDNSPIRPILGRTGNNSGTKVNTSTPIPVSKGATKEARPYIPPPRPPAMRVGAQTTGPRGGKDRMLARVAFQDESVGGGAAAAVRTTQPGGPPAQPGAMAPAGDPDAAGQPLPPPVPGQPSVRRPGTIDPAIDALPNVPGEPPLDRQRLGEVGRMAPAEAVGLAGILVPIIPPMNESDAAGLPKDFKAYKLNMQQAFLISLINGRYYQYQLETLYEAALPVTLQRFAFEPQFYAGLSPTTGVPQTGGSGGSGTSIGGGSFAPATGLSTANSFSYSTRFAPTGQVSTMNIGTVAGMGKLFNSGAQMLLGFASELVFNFAGKNPTQPTVLSSLPFSFVQPLLRGGGRAVILEPLTLQERALLYQVRAFAQFRQQYFVVTLTGGTIQNFGNTFALAGFSSAGNNDPTIGFIPAAFNVVQVEIDRRNVAFFQNLVKLYQELIQGESSGLSQLQVDQVMSSLIRARQTLFNDKITYRSQLDQFKMQLGMPPDTPIVMDQSFLGTPFYRVFDAVDAWQRRPDRSLSELPGIIGKIPQLQDIDVDGRSALGIYRNYRAARSGVNFVAEDEDGLEDLLQAAVRIALEYRLDLMNNRAQLYDAWRQIRIAANALKGILNVTLTNNLYTGPYTTNPFAFMSQAKNFSLVLNAELPLVRMTERNNFRTALISYQRQRRSLMNVEDNLKIQLRNDLRAVHTAYIGYEINKRNYELNVRLKDQAFEQIVAPPGGGSGGLAQSANAATQTTNLLSFQNGAYGSQVALITGYENYQTQRLIFYRDIGTLPYDEWEAFRELFPTEYRGPIFGHSDGRPGLTDGAEAPPPPGIGR
jgi:hypothetical protein